MTPKPLYPDVTLPGDTAPHQDITFVTSTHRCKCCWLLALLCGMSHGGPALGEQPQCAQHLLLPMCGCVLILSQGFGPRCTVWWAAPGLWGMLRSNPPKGAFSRASCELPLLSNGTVNQADELRPENTLTPLSHSHLIGRGTHSCVSHPITSAGREEPWASFASWWAEAQRA